ncbi:MAG: universal stress protein [Nitrospirae bacterium]|nr:universal stress protein [Nitrospirota bacterium]MCL5420993.1 universal stress protein [Nitrospirota bacterium]
MKILFATDGSECSEAAAKFLTRFHFTPRDEIVVLHVVSEIPYDDDYHAQIRYVIRKVAPKILHSALRILKPVQARISSMEEEGAPDTTIIKIATDSSADLVVMGARGLKGITSLFLGSVTRSVAINSPKPVLVTKPYQWEEPERMKILFATDGSPSALSTARLLAAMPFPPHAELTIMNVAWSAASDIPERFFMEVDDKIKQDVAMARKIEMERSEKIIEEAKAHLGRRFARVTAIAKGGDPSLEILNESESEKPDLIAMGSRGMKGIKGMLGSVSRRILSRSQCPVLIGKTGEG